MTRIINYLKNGRGIGTLFLALLAVIITVQVFYASKKVILAMIPEVQNTLDQLLPIEIENGVVIEPANTVKNVKLKVPFVPGYAGFPVILDTRVDSLDFDELLKSKSSVQISRKNVYIVSKGEVKVRSLGDASYRFEKQDYQEKMKDVSEHYLNIFAVACFVILLAYYLLIALFYAAVTFLFTGKWEEKPTFSSRMRVGSTAVFAISVLNLLLGYAGLGISGIFFLAAVTALAFWLTLQFPDSSDGDAAPKTKA